MMVKVRVMKGTDPPHMENGVLMVHTNEERRNNVANHDVIRQISPHFKVSVSDIRLISGMKSKRKVFYIPES